MKRMFTLLIATIIISATCHAQDSTSSECWSGEIELGSQKLDVSFIIKTSSDGIQTCTMDVPTQGAKNIPTVLEKNDSDSLNISVPMLRANYKGRKVSSESIEGIFFQNGFSLPLNLKQGKIELKRPQTPQQPFPYETEEVVFRNDTENAVLSGTLTYPVNYKKNSKKAVPVVLMVTGSGSQNRDEELFDHKPFLVIADFLAKNGIASLRYDDRGFAKSTGPTEGITSENLLADAEAGIAYLRSLDIFGKIGVLGHSEGGTIAFLMGANKSVDFIISLAGSAANGIDVIVGQNEVIMQQQGVSKDLTHDYATALRIIYNDRINKKHIENKTQYIEDLCEENKLTLPDAFKTNLEKCISAGGEWLTWFLGYNPAENISKIKCPVMALNGDLDLQVLSKDNLTVIEDNLPRNKKNMTKEYKNLNHLFQHCTLATSLDYGNIEETISEEVLKDITNWINTIK